MREGLIYDIMVDVDERPDGWNKELYDKLSFEYLVECAQNNKIGEWNQEYEKYLKSEWQRLFPNEEYDPKNKGKLFDNGSDFVRLDFPNKNLKNAILERANFSGIHLEGANLSCANFKGANFSYAHLERARLLHSNLEEIDFKTAHLDGTCFLFSNLDRASFINTHLEGAYFWNAHLNGTYFTTAHLDGADFSGAYLQGGKFIMATVNGDTLFTNNTIDKKTDFTGTSLSSARIVPGLRTQLERNIREIRWEEWYKDNKMLVIPAKVFWKISDYGSSTRDIVFTFLFSNFIFTMFYLALRDADLLHGTILSSGNDLLLAYMQTTLVPFGILGIDLTTLSLFPVFIIFIQVIFGYTILAALVTRMAIMFQNLSP
ncbi:MAG: pentapeptide repeat-containing protein [Methanocorpusculum sp.]|uniref:pentapeptide repeat-containing protein n=1 Tax=Methanocorpusculum sp. TaxID=2058474 RepID=UPI00271D58AA|nr:pentapeptide repeat-containing protein [Methanocorpusculum sp.]MDO9522280.1 pentapeptide repeat-containing protein [Methanocorpusculum sp.]